jgi:hypothetical protein
VPQGTVPLCTLCIVLCIFVHKQCKDGLQGSPKAKDLSTFVYLCKHCRDGQQRFCVSLCTKQQRSTGLSPQSCTFITAGPKGFCCCALSKPHHKKPTHQPKPCGTPLVNPNNRNPRSEGVGWDFRAPVKTATREGLPHLASAALQKKCLCYLETAR